MAMPMEPSRTKPRLGFQPSPILWANARKRKKRSCYPCQAPIPHPISCESAMIFLRSGVLSPPQDVLRHQRRPTPPSWATLGVGFLANHKKRVVSHPGNMLGAAAPPDRTRDLEPRLATTGHRIEDGSVQVPD